MILGHTYQRSMVGKRSQRVEDVDWKKFQTFLLESKMEKRSGGGGGEGWQGSWAGATFFSHNSGAHHDLCRPRSQRRQQFWKEVLFYIRKGGNIVLTTSHDGGWK
jgi:hypothetical protein